MIKVLLADDHGLFRDSLKKLLEQDEEIRVVACAKDGKDAFELCKLHMPDIVLMDIMMPDYDGVEGVRLIKEKYEKIKVIMLTSVHDDYNISQSLKNGAEGYLSKDLRGDELINSIKSAFDGVVVMQKNTLNTLVNKLDSKCLKSHIESKRLDIDLSDKEREIIKLLVEGLSNKEIAAHFKVSEGSIKNSLTHILKKLNLEGRVQLVVYAIRNDLV